MQAASFDRFVCALHRRFCALRALERIGGGLLIGCGASLLLLPLAMWRGVPTMALIWLMLGCCGGMGLLAGLLRRPTGLDAAMEADRQLQLADLLSTALSVRRSSDVWAMTVVALAEHRCGEISPSAVLLGRWGVRAWSGVALATALVITLGMFSTQANPTRAGISPLNPFDQRDTLGLGETSSSVAYSPQRHPAVGQNPQDDIDSSAESRGRQMTDKTQADQTDGAQSSTANPHQATAADPNRSGTGAARTLASPSNLPPSVDPPKHEGSGTQGQTATGGQSDNTSDNANHSNSVSGLAGQGNHRLNTPPWTSGSWDQDAQRALHQSDSRPEYQAYRDLVRGYFQRP